jgi:hypothetical protein
VRATAWPDEDQIVSTLAVARQIDLDANERVGAACCYTRVSVLGADERGSPDGHPGWLERGIALDAFASVT